MGEKQERFTLKQEHIEMLENRRGLDAEFKSFMQESLADRKSIREALAENTRATHEVHLALFAKDDDNELGITGLVISMQRVLKHVEVVCGIAQFFKRLVIGGGSVAAAIAAILALGEFFGRWG